MDAVLQVLAQKVGLDLCQRCTNRLDLCDDVYAVAILFDHFRYAPDLAFDALQGGSGLFGYFRRQLYPHRVIE